MTPFLLLEWLLSENAVVVNLVGPLCRFLAKPHLRYLEVTLVRLTTNQLCRHKFDKGEYHGVNETQQLQHAGEESSPPPECSPASRQPGDKEDEAEEDEAMSAAVNYATSLTLNDEQLYYANNVAVGGNDDAGGDNRGMNVDSGGDYHGLNDDEGGQQVEEEMGEAWERVTKKRKSQMSNDELRT